MKEYWISWYAREDDGPFELTTPWWISGYVSATGLPIFVGAVRADSEGAAWQTIVDAHDNPPEKGLIERFCDEMKGDKYPWDNPNGRFQRADWMQW